MQVFVGPSMWTAAALRSRGRGYYRGGRIYGSDSAAMIGEVEQNHMHLLMDINNLLTIIGAPPHDILCELYMP